MNITITQKRNLASLLGEHGHSLDLRCGGRGVCGRCGVRLLSGEWIVEGKRVTAPAEALACMTILSSDCGEVEFTPIATSENVSDSWTTTSLPISNEIVVAVDIGTTTIAAVKIQHGKVIAHASCFNSQSQFGDNVISRINHASDKLHTLQELVKKSIKSLFEELDMTGVSRIAIAGNTVMLSLFHGVDPSSIGVLPFTPKVRVFPNSMWEDIELLTMPCIAGFVGGDLTAGLYETKLKSGEMLIDIGTNCEIIFCTENETICTAAAAGPAFEGAGLHFGCRASKGAIDHYYGANNFSVIGDERAIGLCGSAFIDFLAVERKNENLNEFGRYQPVASQKQINSEIFVHEYDIEQLLKAKAAVWGGIVTLEEYCHKEADKIYLAGGFAQFIDLKNAIAIGMLPPRNYEIVGNTSLAGAARLAVDPALMVVLERLIDKPREIALNLLENFEDNFIDGLMLP